ncbi:LptF/LptG family permease [Rubinisphaera italica]|uniref:Putative permease YjgP/YjgQ family protein n=1 Tax=Rubinisphaera italica TaxID=2527969 RepID=A0A5C5XB00_9PLAN|nr:LptF/LptG family permease [Rubinisphaera italica]TWT60327.1 putative permease YjgP/YjgQ family protein [Rubinisphaera italica]
MRLLQRYITGELLRVFVMVLIAISILLVFVGVFQQATENGLGPVEVLQILPYVIYSLLPITIPATMLLTVTVVYGRMSGDQELIAARAAGINLISLLWPALLMGASLSAGALVLTDRVIPWSIDKIQETVLLKMEKIFLDQLRSDHQFIDPQGSLAITVIDVDQKTLIKPTIRYTPKSGQTFTIQAESANIHFNLSEGVATIKVVGGYIHMSDGRGAWIREEEYPFPLPLIDKQRKARHMAANEISKELQEIKQKEKERESRQTIATAMNLMTGRFEEFTKQDFLELVQGSGTDLQRSNKLKTEYHSRFAMAGSCFFFVLVGSPISIIHAKKQFLTTFFMVFMPIVFIYYPIIMLSMNQAKNGALEAYWVMWVANVLASFIGGYLLWKVMRN